MKKFILVHLAFIILNNLFSQNSNNNIIMAKLKGINDCEMFLNNTVVGIIKSTDSFIYDQEGHTAYLQNGKSGYISPEKIEKINMPYFKFLYSIDDFKVNNDDLLFEHFAKKGNDLKKLLESIILKKDEFAIRTFFQLKNSMDGEAAECYSYLFWKIINFWSDDELFNFLDKQVIEFKKEFCNYMIMPYVTWPIVDYKQYYKLYFPKTWQIIKSNAGAEAK